MKKFSLSEIEHLNNASLDFWHVQSKEWFNDLQFWQDEMSFYYKLLHKKESKPSQKKELASIEREVFSINSKKLEKLKIDIQEHQRLLANIIKSGLKEEETLRKSHLKLASDFMACEEAVRKLKIKVFSFVNQE